MVGSSRRIACAPRYLPRQEWPRAATNAIAVNPENRPPGFEMTEVPTGSDGERLALDVTRYWGRQGVNLTVGFLDQPELALRNRILLHLNAWGKTANVLFVESADQAQVRIARWSAKEAAPGQDGYWSYLGTDILLIHPDRPTMNLEAFTMQTPDSEFHRVVRHEAGHTLGFPHEHMRKALVSRLNRQKVIDAYMKSQGWTQQEVIDQILTPLEESSLLGTPAQSNSIMCYEIDGRLTLDGEPIVGGTDITADDHAFAAQIYPKPPG
ncbi:hypothetical protein AB7645_41165 [Bradyrhizobium sp. 956_D2_N1_5]|uniref:hypothetical protein n=1 Tax=unclassified Bradyrhizobium TaxID=2631580 RepID=UPI003F281E1C